MTGTPAIAASPSAGHRALGPNRHAPSPSSVALPGAYRLPRGRAGQSVGSPAMPARTLSEADSKALLAAHGVPFAPERVVATADEAVAAAAELGFPVVVKLCGDAIAHKTERGLVRLGLGDAAAVRAAAAELLAAATPDDGEVGLLVAPDGAGQPRADRRAGRRPAVRHDRHARRRRDPRRGGRRRRLPARARSTAVDAEEMIDDLATQALLGAVPGRAGGRPRRAGRRAARPVARPPRPTRRIASADLNPLIVVDGTPDRRRRPRRGRRAGDRPDRRRPRPPTDEQFRALFDPQGVVVAGASTHPGKFGFVALHNILAAGYEGAGLRHQPRGGRGPRRPDASADIDELPDGAADLVFVCTPASANPDLLRAARRQGHPGRVRHLGRLRRGGRGGHRRPRPSWWRWPTSSASCSPGPNGQGVVSTPSHAVRPDRGARTRRPGASASPASRATSCRRS